MSTASAPSSRAKNVVANYLSLVSTIGAQVFLVPIYVSKLGQEKFGVIGFFLSMQALLQVFDLGLGTSLNRELARRSTGKQHSHGEHTLVRSLEWISWGVGATIGCAIVALGWLVADRWLTTAALSKEELARAIRWMGLAIAVQWPNSLYAGGLQGLERQFSLAKVTTVANLGFAFGAIALLSYSPTLTTFFFWRVAVSLASVMATRILLYRSLRAEENAASFDWAATAPIRQFSGGMTAIALTGIALVQLDKVLASRFLALPEVGAYMVASTAAALVPQLVSPIFSAFLPGLAKAFAKQDAKESAHLFRLQAKMIAVFVHPVAIMIAFFAEPLLLVWTKDPRLSSASRPILTSLALGSALNAIMVPIYSLQLAAGWTHLAYRTNLVLLATMAPLGILLTSRLGAPGAALIWPLLNSAYVVLGCLFTLNRLPRGTTRAWLLVDLGLPLCSTTCVAVVVHSLSESITENPYGRICIAIFSGLTCIALALMVHRDIYSTIVARLRSISNRSSSA